MSFAHFDYSDWEAASGSYQRSTEDFFDGGSPYVGEIQAFAGNFAPVGWKFCDGSLLPIADYDTLFQLIGTTYGGDGTTTFAVPDLRGRVPIHFGNNTTNSYVLGQVGGNPSSSLTNFNLPSHNHILTGTTALLARGDNPGTTATPGATAYPAISGANNYYTATAGSASQVMEPLQVSMTVSTVGSGSPVSNFQPYLVVNYIISLFGVYPSQT